MKNIFLLFFSIAAGLSFIRNSEAQSNKQLLIDKLLIYYVANPNSASGSTVLINNSQVSRAQYNGAFWSNSNMSGAQQLVKALLGSSSNGGDANLQRLAAKIIDIRSKPVIVYLLDDSGISLNSNARSNYGACLSGNNKSWPCARAYSGTNPVAGQMSLGTYYLTTYLPSSRSSSNIKQYRFATFLHELTHTQDHADGRYHLFYLGTTWFHYGADGDHYHVEVIPNIVSSYKEGIANVFAMAFDDKFYRDGLDWFARGGNIYVEYPPTGTTGGPSEIWLVRELQREGINPVRNVTLSGVRYAEYRMGMIPVRYITRNEYILAIILESVRREVGTARYVQYLTYANSELFGVCSFPIAVLFDHLCSMGLPSGISRPSELNTTPIDRSFLFPLALADYFTGYRASNKNEFRLMFEEQPVMDPWINLYWDIERPGIMSAAPLSSVSGNPIINIKRALGMN